MVRDHARPTPKERNDVYRGFSVGVTRVGSRAAGHRAEAVSPRLRKLSKSIAELEIRRTTEMIIIAIIRGDQAINAPEPSEVLRAGDRLVVVSRRQDMGPFRDLVVG
jgi:Trk K+ transport system NAD-binding subunit